MKSLFFGSNSAKEYAADDIICMLGLTAHPDGGYYREMFRDTATTQTGRSASTAIYFLISKDQVSRWHRIDAAEVWHWYAGAPLALEIYDGKFHSKHRLSSNFNVGERPQAVVPSGAWQTAHSMGEWTLVGCTVSPGFDASGFELAPADWAPPVEA